MLVTAATFSIFLIHCERSVYATSCARRSILRTRFPFYLLGTNFTEQTVTVTISRLHTHYEHFFCCCCFLGSFVVRSLWKFTELNRRIHLFTRKRDFSKWNFQFLFSLHQINTKLFVAMLISYSINRLGCSCLKMKRGKNIIELDFAASNIVENDEKTKFPYTVTDSNHSIARKHYEFSKLSGPNPTRII